MPVWTAPPSLPLLPLRRAGKREGDEGAYEHGVVWTRTEAKRCGKLAVGGKYMTEAVSRAWKWLRPANRVWLCVTAGTILVLLGFYFLVEHHTDRVARTTLGLTFGGLAFTLMLIATAYSVRKRWRPVVAQRWVGGKERALRKKQLREARILDAYSVMSELQAEVNRQTLQDRSAILRRARQVLKSAKASRLLRVKLEAERGGQVRIRLEEKPPWGRLENWLLNHSYLGFLAALLVALHSGFRLGGGVATAGFVLSAIVGLNGLAGWILYLAIPLAWGRIKNPMFPRQIRAKLREAEGEMATLLKDKSGPLQEMLLSEHELSEEDIAKVEDEEKAALQSLLELRAQKRALEAYLARHLRYQGYLWEWHFVHVAAATFLLISVIIHVVSIFYY
jgi:hypothetical protein